METHAPITPTLCPFMDVKIVVGMPLWVDAKLFTQTYRLAHYF